MKVDIISPEKILFKGDTEVVTLPGVMGSFTILQNHAPIVSVLTKGTITYGSHNKKVEIPIESGFVEANNNTITICVEQQ
ncbi:ATP synthase subunit epsilon [Porphyromonadaceae bacterium COT-184 OH4590]|nr:ATP synthase subunit epsilon [Porphyromonadaceae bacterium COT-184 OH4590]MDO4726666.1 F0F1 ATP synthase subunit epsilon [Porphyromonadaceae bacterium]